MLQVLRRRHAKWARAGAATTILLMVAGVMTLGTNTAGADTAPATGTPATVSADALPTVQEDGVVWAQVTVGNIVYATGSFAETWPAGMTNTTANDTPRGNLLAYDITTGNLVTSFNHTLNGQGLALAASPDGSRVYVGGDFTTVDGQSRSHVAAFDVATGALDSSFKPTVSGSVHAIAANDTNVYVGGSFTKSGTSSRLYLAGFTAPSGALLANWTPSVEQQVDALLITPDQSEVVIGGAFQTLNGTNAYGLGAVTVGSGATVPYAVNQTIRDYSPANTPAGDGAAILSLTTDGSQIYGSGYSYYEGNFEGTFAVSPDTGVINWIDDCHGDTYSVQSVGSVLYSASHAHDCSGIGQFPDTSPRVNHHALAEVNTPSTSYNVTKDSYGWNYSKYHDTTLLDWYPTFKDGTYTKQTQATWSVTGNSSYLSYGGEFPSVNGVAQAGLVRFAVSSIAPNKSGPIYSSTLTPTVTALNSTSATVNWTSTWDEDNQALTYKVYRNGAGPVYQTTTSSNFWQLPTAGFTDTGLTPGATYSYKVYAYDPFNNTTNGSTTSVTLPGGSVTTPNSASDSFNRTVSGGWGTADTGGAWTSSSATSFSVSSGVGSIAMAAAGSGPNVYLPGLTSTSTDTTAIETSNVLATGGGTSLETIGRRISANTEYYGLVKILSNNTISLEIVSLNAGTSTVLAGPSTLSGVTFAANLKLNVELQITGTSPTTTNFKVWPTTTTEPTGWQLTATDNTAALQAAGSVGFAAYLSASATNAPVSMLVSSFATAPVS
jgi:hypothetical protein